MRAFRDAMAAQIVLGAGTGHRVIKAVAVAFGALPSP